MSLNYVEIGIFLLLDQDYFVSLRRFRIDGNWRQTIERKTKG